MASTDYKKLEEHVELCLSVRKINSRTISAEQSTGIRNDAATAFA